MHEAKISEIEEKPFMSSPPQKGQAEKRPPPALLFNQNCDYFFKDDVTVICLLGFPSRKYGFNQRDKVREVGRGTGRCFCSCWLETGSGGSVLHVVRVAVPLPPCNHSFLRIWQQLCTAPRHEGKIYTHYKNKAGGGIGGGEGYALSVLLSALLVTDWFFHNTKYRLPFSHSTLRSHQCFINIDSYVVVDIKR
jgi:hypothetical protein